MMSPLWARGIFGKRSAHRAGSRRERAVTDPTRYPTIHPRVSPHRRQKNLAGPPSSSGDRVEVQGPGPVPGLRNPNAGGDWSRLHLPPERSGVVKLPRVRLTVGVLSHDAI